MTENEEEDLFMLKSLLVLNMALRKDIQAKNDDEALRKENQNIMRLMYKISKYGKEEHYNGA